MSEQRAVSQATVAGVVVLYQSSPRTYDNLLTYLPQLDKLYLVDNTPGGVAWLPSLLPGLPTVVYVPLGENKGIAHALNEGAKRAIADGYAYLLTMDDDSQAPPDLIAQLGAYWNAHLTEPIGIVAPRHQLITATQTAPVLTTPTPVLTTMTSGNLISLAAYQQVGGFDDALFIDVVDHDYTLKLAVQGYRVIELPTVALTHALGQQRSLLSGRLRYITHSPLRNYYLIRNSLLIGRRYRRHFPAYYWEALRTVAVEIGKIVLLEEQKATRLRYVWRALRDGLS